MEHQTDQPITNKTLWIIGGGFTLLLFIMSGFSPEALAGGLFSTFVGIMVYKRVWKSESESREESAEIIVRHNNPSGYKAYKEQQGMEEMLASTDEMTIGILDDFDMDSELNSILSGVFTNEEVKKIEHKNSEFDPEFHFSKKNIFHYLLKGKQL